MNECIYVYMYVCMDGWMDGWMYMYMYVCMSGWIFEKVIDSYKPGVPTYPSPKHSSLKPL